MSCRTLALCLFSVVFQSSLSAEDVDYLATIKPLLTEKCSSCHGPLKQEAGLRLDAAVFIRRGAESGKVVIAGQPAKSALIDRVSTQDVSERMPPEGDGEPLTPEQIAQLAAWIEAGMLAPDDEEVVSSPHEHWAYQPIVRPKLPELQDSASDHPIDRFLAAKWKSMGLQPVERAEPASLLRRLSLDVIGLPPTVAELQQFGADPSQSAYESLVHQLLESPRYGERWGRHWMDVWRYSDWDGYKDELRGSQRHIWHWRDWIIESLNSDKRYDQMIVEMLAGDEVAPTDPDILRATGFLARNFHKSNRDIWLDATVEHTTKAFLGVTLNCARCHDHKFDPISQPEYYQFRAIFEPYNVRTDRLPGEANIMNNGIARAYDKDLEVQTFLYQSGNEKRPDKDHPLAAGVVKILGLPYEPSAVELPPQGFFPALNEFVQSEDLDAARKTLFTAQTEFKKLNLHPNDEGSDENFSDTRPPAPLLPEDMTEAEQLARYKLSAAQRRVTSLAARWAADRAKYESSDEADSENLDSLSASAAKLERKYHAAKARLETFQKWQALNKAHESEEKDAAKKQAAIDKSAQDLTAVREAELKSKSALGQTDANYTPVGEIYPQQSTGRRSALAQWIVNPSNPLTARVAVNHIWLRHFGTPLVDNMFDFGLRTPKPKQAELLDWLAAEFMESGWSMKHIHQLILTSTAYQFSSSASDEVIEANSAIDPDNEYFWRANVQRLESEIIRDELLFVSGQLDLTMGGPDLDYEQGESVPRRSVYFRHAYEKQMLMMTIFDAASPTECYRRSPSVIPQQALALANSSLSVTAARKLTAELSNAATDDRAFIERAFLTLLSRSPLPEEVTACQSFLEEQSKLLQVSASSNEKTDTQNAETEPHQRARENLTHVLLNHNDFVSVR